MQSSEVQHAINGTKIVIRPMTQHDIAEILVIDRESHQFPWSENTLRDCIRVGYDCWILENHDGQIPGYGVMSMTLDECHILNVCIRPSWQRHGLGRALMDFLLKLGIQRGAVVSFLEVRASNTPAIQLYENIGYEQIELRKDYYPAEGGREDALIYRLKLATDAGDAATQIK